jgi:segregation and condensation protein B
VARVFGAVTGAETTAEEVEAAVARLNDQYEATGRAFRLQHWAGGYRLATEPDVAPFVRALLAREHEQRLSRALLETLAVVAYRQPVSKPEIDHVRGVNADHALRSLLERDFITVAGRGDGVGRPLLYGTTERFLDLFGLGTLEELPRPREIEELLADPSFARERAALLAANDPDEGARYPGHSPVLPAEEPPPPTEPTHG